MKNRHIEILNKFLAIIISAFLMLSLVLFGLPQTAYAYETIKAHTWKATITANVNTDGTVEARESRIVDITPFVNKAKSAKSPPTDADIQTIQTNRLKPVVWNFGGMPEDSWTEVTGISYSLLTDNDTQIGQTKIINNTPYDKKYNGNYSPTTEAYTYDNKENQVLLYTYVLNNEELTAQQAAAVMAQLTGNPDPATWTCNRINLVFSYKLFKAVLIYKDVADFKWIYASDSWLMDSYNVDVLLNIPVGTSSVRSVFDKLRTDTAEQLNATQIDQNIYAWGHGSANGVVKLDSNGTITLKDDIVPARTNAELRVAFPSSWLTNLNANSELSYSNQTKLSSILKEESVWHDSKSKEVVKLLFLLFVLGVSILGILFLLIFVHLYKQKFQTQTLQKENIKDLHPCTILRLKNWNREHAHDITESILYLEDCKIIKITQQNNGLYALTLLKPEYLSNNIDDGTIDDIDKNTINLLFKHINKGKTTITTEDIFNYAKARSESFLKAYKEWHQFLKAKTRKLAGFKKHHKSLRRSVYVSGFILFVVSCILAALTLYPQTAIVGLGAWLVMCYIANSMRNKIVIVSKNGKTTPITKLSMTIDPEKKANSDFKLTFDTSIETAVKKAYENVQYLTLK